MSTNGNLVVTWDQFMAERAPSVPAIWGDALLVKGGGYTLLGGDTGVGKTVLIANLLLHLADARETYLGFQLPGRVVPSLILEAEGNRYKFRDWVAHIAQGLGIRPSPAISFHERNAALVIGDTLESMIAESKAEIVFLDTIGRFWAGSENDATEWRAGVTIPLAKLAAGFDAAFLFGDHYNRPAEHKTGHQRVRGTTAKIQDAGAAMRLEFGKAGKSSRSLTIDRVRDGALPDPDRIALTIDLKAGTVAIDEREDADPGPTVEPRLLDVRRLLDALATPGLGKVSTASLRLKIQTELGLEKSRATDLIASAVAADVIEKAGHGYYQAPGTLLDES